MVEICIMKKFYDSMPDGSGLGGHALGALQKQIYYIIEEADALAGIFGRDCAVDDLRVAQIAEAKKMELDPKTPTRDAAAFLQRITYWHGPAKSSQMEMEDPHGYSFEAQIPGRELRIAGMYSEKLRPRLTLIAASYPEFIFDFCDYWLSTLGHATSCGEKRLSADMATGVFDRFWRKI